MTQSKRSERRTATESVSTPRAEDAVRDLPLPAIDAAEAELVKGGLNFTKITYV